MHLLNKISQNKNVNKPVIYGLSSHQLSDAEKYFFEKSGAIGFILFSRNIQDKAQVKALVNSLKEVMDGEVLILIDQEGGRVQRLKGKEWKDYPSGKFFADSYLQNKDHAKKLCYDNFSEIAKDLVELGINTNCAPLLDIITPETHKVIGDRAFGDTAKQVTDLARQVCDAFLDNKIYPVIKHIPGHGRGTLDSHLELPVVSTSLKELEETDFLSFMELKDQQMAMTAHILYSAIDDKLPATISPKMIDLIRHKIGFKNILMSDDISMEALRGGVDSRSDAALKAGCDLILHCNGKMEEMKKIDSMLPNIGSGLMKKLSD
ncbi:MAG: nagZ [Rickettsiaceae bacterium]|jgi:beta-N-acetylhexosaminidase|nr:nagZ [Rickettsiaceae bacterium]